MDKITIIVPVYNAENTIERCLASFISNRDYIQEVILINDRSTDRTFEKIDQFRTFFDIRVIDNEGNKGPGPGRRTGLLAANSEWITFVDADDCLTPSSLYYVTKKLDEQPELLLLHTQSIYYESGSFVKENVAHSDYSCGGNFYKRQYLIENHLLPHEELYMAEDEYFNYIILKYIEYYEDKQKLLVSRYNYPVYEVHHDTDKELSFSYQHWSDYLCKYHLLKAKYCAEFFKNDVKLLSENKSILLKDFIFCFFLFNGLAQDETQKFNESELFNDFYQIIKYCKDTFNITANEIISYYQTNKDIVRSLREGAFISAGCKIKKNYSFTKFVRILYNHED